MSRRVGALQISIIIIMLTVLGSLSALSALESAAAARRAEEVRATSQTYNLRSQTEKIKQLKLKRDELLQKLHNSSTGKIHPHVTLLVLL